MFLFISINDRALHESSSRDFPCRKKRILGSLPCHPWILLLRLLNSALVVLTLTFHGHPISEDGGIHIDHGYAIRVDITAVLILQIIHPVHYVSLIA